MGVFMFSRRQYVKIREQEASSDLDNSLENPTAFGGACDKGLTDEKPEPSNNKETKVLFQFLEDYPSEEAFG